MNFCNLKVWLMNKLVNVIVVAAFLFFVIFIIIIAGLCSGFQGLPVSSNVKTVSSTGIIIDDNKNISLAKYMLASTNALSTKKIEWGIKRNDNHAQPDLGATNKKLIEEYGGIAMGNTNSKNIYLTFDLGYEGGYTEKILDVLKNNNVPAVFFITGQMVKTNPEIIKRMIDEGHIVGNQSPHTLMDI